MTIDWSKMITAEQKAAQENEQRRAGVIAERARRLATGFDYDFGDERGIHRIGTTAEDEKGWDEVQKWAVAMTALGDTESTLLISTDTGTASVTATDWCAIVAHGASVQQPIWQASFVLQEMDPVPEDYADDKYWT